ncbi:hypothetical protein WJX77_012237 [Trebouxia sp. C0004]
MPEAAKAGQPPWQHLSGIKRITSEFKHLHRSVQNGQSSQLSNLILVNDEVTQWRFELKNFDDSIAAGHQLNQDLQQLMSQHSQDFLLMEVTFPQAYPQEPPFLRVVSPRCVWYTGHVTAGGAICLEILTNTGSANGWRSDYCAESIVQIAIMNMLHCESVMIRTPSGGGRSGSLRLDLQHRYCRNAMQRYTMQEARSAFHRLLRHHQANGWDSTPPDHSHPGHHPHTAPRPSRSGHNTHAQADGAGKDSASDPSEAQAKGDSTPLTMSKQPITMSQHSITLLQQPAQGATGDPVGLHNEPGVNGQQVLAQPAQVDLTNSPDGSNTQLHEGQKGTRGRSHSPEEITVKGNGMQHGGDKGTKNSSCSSQSILEDPNDGADADMRAMSEEVVDLLSPEKLVIDHSAAFSAGLDSQQMQASAQVAAAAEQHARLPDSLEEMHQGMLTMDRMAPAVAMETDNACIDLTESDDMDVVPAAGAAHASTAAASTSDAPSAAPSAEAARVRQLEVQLAQFQAQASKLEAQNLQLTSELEKAQKVSQEGARMASLVQPPRFWQAHAQGQAVLYVELPIPPMSADGVVATSGSSGDVQLGVLHKTWINDMRTNGVELDDALAALRKHKGDEDAALGMVMEASSNGGVMKYLQLIEGMFTVPPPMQPVADACDRQLEAETEMVMGWWEKHGGLPRSQITSIRRVQNQPLWTKYALKRADIQEARADSHETWLFHGAHKSCIELIAAKGFDIRVSRHGMLGQGTYFANCSAYSDRYARMGPERAGVAVSSGLGSIRSMTSVRRHQLHAQMQQQQAGPVSVDPSGMTGPHALLTSGPPKLWPGNAPVRSAAQSAFEAAAQATAAAVHLRGPAAYSYPFKITAADAAGQLPHDIAAMVQQHREAVHKSKSVIFQAAGANAASANRSGNPAADEGTGATTDVAFPEDISELRQHRFRQTPPRQILQLPAASTAAAAQPDQVSAMHPNSSAAVGVPGHLPKSGLAEQNVPDQVRVRKRNRYGQWEAALTSASQHDKSSEGAPLSGSFKLPYGLRPLPQGSHEHVNVQPQETVRHPKGQSGAMPPSAPRQSADRATDRYQSLQDVPASSLDPVSRSVRLIERLREKRMLSSEDDLIHRQPSRLHRPRQPPFVSDQQLIGKPCNKGPAPRALNGGADSMHTAEGSARPLRPSCDNQDGEPSLSHMLPTSSFALPSGPDPAPVMCDSFAASQTASQSQESARHHHTAQSDIGPATIIFASLLPYSDQHCRQAHVPARQRGSLQSDVAQPRPGEEAQLASTHRRPHDGNSHIVPDGATAVLDQGRLRHAEGVEQNKACRGHHQGGSSLLLADMAPQHWKLPETIAAAVDDAAMVKGGEEEQQQQPAQSAPMSRAGRRVRFADTARVGKPFTKGQTDIRTDMVLSASDKPELPPAAGHKPYSRTSAMTTAAAAEAASGKVTKDVTRDESQGYPVNPQDREAGRLSKRCKLATLSQLQGKQEGYRYQDVLQSFVGHHASRHQANGQNEGQGELAEYETTGHDHRGDGQGLKRGRWQGHKGKGSPSQTADSNGPAGAVLLGSSLDPAANEVTSKAAADHSLSSSGALSPYQHLQSLTGSGLGLASGASDRRSEAESLTMLLSRVALGKTVKGSSDLRRPPDGFDACFHNHRGRTEIFCVYDNAQAYPEYIITYNGARNAAR